MVVLSSIAERRSTAGNIHRRVNCSSFSTRPILPAFSIVVKLWLLTLNPSRTSPQPLPAQRLKFLPHTLHISKHFIEVLYQFCKHLPPVPLISRLPQYIHQHTVHLLQLLDTQTTRVVREIENCVLDTRFRRQNEVVLWRRGRG